LRARSCCARWSIASRRRWPLEETRKQVTLADWKTTLAGDDPTKQRAFDNFFVQPAVERTWRQLRGEPDK